MKKILITGASGFVGSFLVEAFLAADPTLEVYAGVRKTSSRKFLTDPRIHFFEMDFSNQKKLEKDLGCLLYTSPSPRDQRGSRMPSSA